MNNKSLVIRRLSSGYLGRGEDIYELSIIRKTYAGLGVTAASMGL